MLFVLSSLGKSVLSPLCQAPQKVAAIAQDYTLAHISVLTRHGHRTPEFQLLPVSMRGQWTCDDNSAPAPRMEAAPSKFYRYYQHLLDQDMIDYPPSCRCGDLTILGQKMQEELGAKYRDFLVNDLKFLPEKMNPSLFDFFASGIERTYRSAEAFINGLYPPGSNNEVIKIATGTSSASPIRPETCKEFSKIKTEFQSSEGYKKMLEDLWPTLKAAADELGLAKSVASMHTMCGWAMAFNCSVGSNPPLWMNEQFMNACITENSFSQYGLFNSTADHAVPGAPVIREMMRVADQAIKSDKKFALHSAHDTSIGAVLVMMGISYANVPAYASHLAMELLRNKSGTLFVRFVFNGEVLTLPHFNESIVEYSAFAKYIEPFNKYCPEL